MLLKIDNLGIFHNRWLNQNVICPSLTPQTSDRLERNQSVRNGQPWHWHRNHFPGFKTFSKIPFTPSPPCPCTKESSTGTNWPI